MITRFQNYAGSVKPALAGAYAMELARVLEGCGPEAVKAAQGSLAAGKKLRGTLTCLVAGALGGPLSEALPRAVAIELIQAATLLHDDFVDQHQARRHLPALWTLQGARRAVLLGDVIFSTAIYLMGERGRENGLIVSRAIAEISRGAYREPLGPAALLSVLDMGEDSGVYDKIIDLKTAVLFAAACQLGAVAAGAGPVEQEAWRDYGLRIGQAYQLTDDLQDVEGALVRGEVTSAVMTGLVPAFCQLLPASRSCLRRALQTASPCLDGEAGAYFLALASLLRQERERRLEQALEGLADSAGGIALDEVVRRAPREIIGLFEESEELTPAASPP